MVNGFSLFRGGDWDKSVETFESLEGPWRPVVVLDRGRKGEGDEDER